MVFSECLQHLELSYIRQLLSHWMYDNSTFCKQTESQQKIPFYDLEPLLLHLGPKAFCTKLRKQTESQQHESLKPRGSLSKKVKVCTSIFSFSLFSKNPSVEKLLREKQFGKYDKTTLCIIWGLTQISSKEKHCLRGLNTKGAFTNYV